MSFSLSRFAQLRPYLYHLTSESNVERILREQRLHCAKYWFERADQIHWCRTKRGEHVTLIVDGEEIVIRDQFPLYEGKMRLEDGVSFSDFIEILNSRVFFWPGGERGPSDYGRRHFGRYCHEMPAMLRIPTQQLFELNLDSQPRFCRYNSGSPRPSNGIHPSRGRLTFVKAHAADFTAGMVVEVTFEGTAILPAQIVRHEMA